MLLTKINFFSDKSLKEMRSFEKKIRNQVFAILSPQNSIKNKKSTGGTAPETLK